jgi:hypothetical protein
MAQQGQNDLTYDSAGTIINIVFGIQLVPFMKFTPPKVTTKTDKPDIVGEGLSSVQTPGRTTIDDGNGEILLTHWKDIILPAFNKHGSNLLRFNVIRSIRHPSIKGSYAELYELCRIVGREGPETDGSEKALTKKVTISAMNVWERADGGAWKCAAFLTKLPSSEAAALMGWAK